METTTLTDVDEETLAGHVRQIGTWYTQYDLMWRPQYRYWLPHGWTYLDEGSQRVALSGPGGWVYKLHRSRHVTTPNRIEVATAHRVRDALPGNVKVPAMRLINQGNFQVIVAEKVPGVEPPNCHYTCVCDRVFGGCWLPFVAQLEHDHDLSDLAMTMNVRVDGDILWLIDLAVRA